MEISGFHGTSKVFTKFAPSSTGSFGAGIYFADTIGSAIEYGSRVIEVVVKLENPWIIEADCDGEVNYQEDFDNPALQAVLTLRRGRRLVEKAKRHVNGHFDQELQDQLVALGHDGIVATYPGGSCKEIVAFRTCQVKFVGEIENCSMA